MSDWLSGLTDWIYNAATGALSPNQVSQIANQTAQDVGKAGGSTAQQQAAANEVTNFANRYWPARGPVQTLWDDATGNPMGIRNPDALPSNLFWAVIIGIAALLLLSVSDSGRGKGNNGLLVGLIGLFAVFYFVPSLMKGSSVQGVGPVASNTYGSFLDASPANPSNIGPWADSNLYGSEMIGPWANGDLYGSQIQSVAGYDSATSN